MNNPRITDNLPSFGRSVSNVLDQALGELAKDILVTARAITPFDKGALRRESDTYRSRQLNWRVRYHMEYALPQEKGSAGNKQFRNYTTAGTGKGYLKKSGDKVMQKAILTLKKHGGRAR